MQDNLLLKNIKEAVIKMDDKGIVQIIEQALKTNTSAQDILNQALIPGMKEVGELFSRKEYFVPEVLLASETFYAGWTLLQQQFKETSTQLKPRAKVVLGVVQGDIHDIGKNIVKVLMQTAGYEVIDLGKDVPSKKFIETVIQEKPDILALSSLMTTTMPRMEEIIKMLEQKGLRNKIKVIIGGAPVNQEFAGRIKADAYGEDGHQAVKLIEQLLDESH